MGDYRKKFITGCNLCLCFSQRLMLGSISNAVAATAPMPVLIVKRFLIT